MSSVKVSIVVPIYNLEKYIPRCLDALVNQTLEDIEIAMDFVIQILDQPF